MVLGSSVTNFAAYRYPPRSAGVVEGRSATDAKCILGAPGRVKRSGCVSPGSRRSELAKLMDCKEISSITTGVHAVTDAFVIDPNSCMSLLE